MIHLLKVEGKMVLNPETKKDVGSEGVKMEELSTYWYRRIKDGSMVYAPEVKTKVSTKDSKQLTENKE